PSILSLPPALPTSPAGARTPCQPRILHSTNLPLGISPIFIVDLIPKSLTLAAPQFESCRCPSGQVARLLPFHRSGASPEPLPESPRSVALVLAGAYQQFQHAPLSPNCAHEPWLHRTSARAQHRHRCP